MTTSASGMAAFCSSVTCPETVPVEVACAQAGVVKKPNIDTQTTISAKKDDVAGRDRVSVGYIALSSWCPLARLVASRIHPWRRSGIILFRDERAYLLAASCWSRKRFRIA